MSQDGSRDSQDQVRAVFLEPELELQIVGASVDDWVRLALVYLRWSQQLLVGFAMQRGLAELRRLLQFEPRWQRLAMFLTLDQVADPSHPNPRSKGRRPE